MLTCNLISVAGVLLCCFSQRCIQHHLPAVYFCVVHCVQVNQHTPKGNSIKLFHSHTTDNGEYFIINSINVFIEFYYSENLNYHQFFHGHKCWLPNAILFPLAVAFLIRFPYGFCCERYTHFFICIFEMMC